MSKAINKKSGQGIIIEKLDSASLLKQASDYYHHILQDDASALAFLKSKGLDDKKLIKHFRLGFGDRTLTASTPSRMHKGGKPQRDALEASGLLRPNGREQLNGCLTFPLYDSEGQIKNIYGCRIIERAKTENRPSHYLLQEPLEHIFNISGLDNHNSVLICNTFIDALSVWQQGLTAVTVNYIENIEDYFNQSLLSYLINSEIKTVYLSGKQNHQAITEQLQQYNIACYRLDYPYGISLNDLLQQAKEPKKTLVQLIKQAEYLSTIDTPLQSFSLLEPLLPKKEETIANNRTNEKVPAKKTDSLTAEHQQEKKVSPMQTDAINTTTTNPVIAQSNIEQLIADNTVIDEHKKTALKINVKDHEVIITIQDRAYRIRGLNKNLSYDQLKINIRASKDHNVHVDSFDLYLAKQRQQYIQQTAKILRCTVDRIQHDMGLILMELEKLQNNNIENALDSKSAEVELTPEERDNALALLQDPKLIDRIRNDIKASGMVGEAENSLLGYLCFISRKLSKPLAMMIQSTSAAGKSTLMNGLLAFVPDEHKTQYSAMTGQSLYYMGKQNLKHHILAIAEESGASNASYALKLLQSEGELTIASTGKDASSGNLETQEYHVEGPVMLSMTTTEIDIDEELLNRCIVLTVNEDRAQTQAIHARQRQNYTLDGIKQKTAKKVIIQQHQNAQRLLKNIHVVNPYANRLTFIDNQTRTRRDHEKYLTLINSIALLHQHQRKVQTFKQGNDVIDYIEVEISDIQLANELAHQALGRSLDELPPQTRALLLLLNEHINQIIEAEQADKKNIHLSRKTIRDFSHWGDTQLKVHLTRLVEMEYLALHKQGNRNLYELLYDGTGEAEPHINGLIDIDELKQQS